MSDSKKTSFRPSRNFISDSVISFVNSPTVVMVANIVSPGCVSECWSVSVGTADAREVRKINKKTNRPLFII